MVDPRARPATRRDRLYEVGARTIDHDLRTQAVCASYVVIYAVLIKEIDILRVKRMAQQWSSIVNKLYMTRAITFDFSIFLGDQCVACPYA